MEIRVGRSDEKYEKVRLWCPWCEHIEKHLLKKASQPTCSNCGRFVPKRRYV
jgi:translation initiation factor 2 beta subunit (eIF-2beta)/eIF-5